MSKTNDREAREIVLTRLYDAPVARVWEAWLEPDQVAQWWGPRGFTLTSHAKDVRPGGIWHYTMHGPDGTDYVNKTLYHVVEPHARLVYDHGGNDERAPMFRVTATFTAVGDKTRLELVMALATPDAKREALRIIKQASGNSTWDRLAEFLAKSQTGAERFVINRSFAAPIAAVYEAWSQPDKFAQWLAPAGFSMEFSAAEIRPGGEAHYRMGNGELTMYGVVRYRELVAPTRLVYTQQFCDAKGAVARHPLAPTWPETMLTVVELAAEGPAQTRVTITWEPIGEVAPHELATFIEGRFGMMQGWTGSLDKLEAYFAAQGDGPR